MVIVEDVEVMLEVFRGPVLYLLGVLEMEEGRGREEGGGRRTHSARRLLGGRCL